MLCGGEKGCNERADVQDVQGVEVSQYPIPPAVQAAARRGLALRKEWGRGGTSVGLNTARILAAGGSIGEDKMRHIAKYFPRHAGDNLSQTGADGKAPSNGYIAWLLWGGDAGRSWSSKHVKAEDDNPLAKYKVKG